VDEIAVVNGLQAEVFEVVIALGDECFFDFIEIELEEEGAISLVLHALGDVLFECVFVGLFEVGVACFG